MIAQRSGSIASFFALFFFFFLIFFSFSFRTWIPHLFREGKPVVFDSLGPTTDEVLTILKLQFYE